MKQPTTSCFSTVGTIGDVYRGYKGVKDPLTDFVSKYFGVFASASSKPFDKKYSHKFPGKGICSIELLVRSDTNGKIDPLLNKAAISVADGKLRKTPYWKIFEKEMLLTEAVFGPVLKDGHSDEYLTLDQDKTDGVNSVLSRLEQRDFSESVTVVGGGGTTGHPALDNNLPQAYYYATEVFGGIDPWELLTEEGYFKLTNEAQNYLNNIRSQVRATEKNPNLIPTVMVFLKPRPLLDLYIEPPLGEYTINLKERLILHEVLMEQIKRLEQSGVLQ